MKNYLVAFVLSVIISSAAFAETFLPGRGVANDQSPESVPQQNVQFIERGNGNSYGYANVSTVLPFGFTFLPFAIPYEECEIRGIRLNLGWGNYQENNSFDVGVISFSGNSAGIQINAFGQINSGNARALQIGLANVVKGDCSGVQIGLVNIAQNSMSGLQIGLLNHTRVLRGIQIGLVNIAETQWSIPIINCAF